ncbi:MAG: DUF2971 domain-containing protein [Planctomycetota bacterium]|nr:DUF2971 domain-containing protein [Planctomycetota bacterium]
MSIGRIEDHLKSVAGDSTVVAHYTKAGTFRDLILRDSKLRLSDLTSVNDPREYKKWSFPSFRGNTAEYEQANDYLDEQLRRHSFVLCGTRNREDEVDCYRNGMMWAHYGESHCGVCLLLNAEALATDLSNQVGDEGEVFSESITYSDELPFEVPVDVGSAGIEAGVSEFLRDENNRRFFLLQKHVAWSCENEHRWIVLNHGRKEPYYADLDNALLGVVVGTDFPHNDNITLQRRFPTSGRVMLRRLDYRYMERPIDVPIFWT